MKNKEFYKLLKKNKFNSNSGFTLIELLVGLFMSIFVIGALGFGLMQVLQISKTEGSKTAARNETGRALDFISDELRRAQAIEVNMSDANMTAVAPGFTLPTGGAVRLALQIPNVNQRVIYSVAPPKAGSPWKGPFVIYRWGPELGANGAYTAASLANPGGWTNEALIDKIDDTKQTETCGGTSTIFYGFFACVLDNDGDGITENATDVDGNGEINKLDTGVTDNNSDGKINDGDGADIDGKAITAQLFFVGETIEVAGTSGYSADTQTLARARLAPENKSDDLSSYAWSVESLGGEFGCKVGSAPWDMRTDFGNDSGNPDNTIKWMQNQDKNKQPKPIEIDATKPLTITSSAVGATGCNNDDRGNDYQLNDDRSYKLDSNGNKILTTGDEALSTYANKVSHKINFGDPKTFNGDQENGTYNNPKVTTTNPTLPETVQFFKKGYNIPTIYGGYDADGDGKFTIPYDADGNGTITVAEGFGSQDQPSLGRFLYSKGLAIPVNAADISNPTTLNNPSTAFKIPATPSELASFLASPAVLSLTPAERSKFKLLGDDQRIIGIEVGQKYTDKDNANVALVNSDGTPKKNPGFDLQDNIFVVTSDVFKKKFKPELF